MEDDESLSMNSLLLNPAPDPAFVSATCFLGLDFFCFFDFSLREKQQTLTTVALWKAKIIWVCTRDLATYGISKQ